MFRSVNPHFLLIRQNLRDGNENYKKLLLGFRYSGVGSVNSIESIYNFQDKPWVWAYCSYCHFTYQSPVQVYAHLLEIQRRLGRENFPLIEQAFYPTHKDMVQHNIHCHVIKLSNQNLLLRITKDPIRASLKLVTLTGVLEKFVLRLQEVFK